MTVKAAIAPGLPESTLDADKLDQLKRLAEGLTAAELYWVAAWSASLAAQSQQGGTTTAASPAKQAAAMLTVVYGSQTGNAKRLAEQLARRGEVSGLPVRLLRADAYPQRELAKERYLAIIISTQGEGEPPDDSRGLVEFVLGKRAPKIPSLQFSVLGLGDSSYAEFCAIGNQLDARLAELGATRFAPLGAADVDIDTVATPWLEKALEQARELLKAPGGSVTTLHAVQRERAQDEAATQPLHSRERPFHAVVLANQRIVSREADRDLRHIELSLEGSGLAYLPGDSLGVWAHNPPTLVAQWLDTLGLDGGIDVSYDGRTLPLALWLKREREITRLSRAFIVSLAAVSGHDELGRLLQPAHSAELAELLNTYQPIDLLRRYRATWSADALIAALRPLTPRLYSIASSQAQVGEEVHLTVAVVNYEAHGSRHWGAASTFLAAVDEDGTVPVFIESNDRFRLPADASRDIIMIGPGTGVAPFRAFVQEREETGAAGHNWLFFGNRHFAQDFLYQTEWQAALKKGALHRLDLAFSRDTAEKIYVQQRLRERGAELYAWLENGAHLYVCGDSTHMAKDVHAALIDVAVTHGGHSPDDAKAWLADLMQQGRYARDVY
ncbi:sulfite reductase (NADPH) flavoprotein alpha-component [Rhodanobacter sp. K2T2]|uniref:assimilatory sulfite reductase (NADPH) flavoprotein subunit n=1 Tax=Rhodanobacter sp. K2T2 TaxID=2723085 RepID=UPI0015CAD882|nr:assimilatory sulfite reductase (NADPH) flavoprotein subunit [Rhodanobacter sp. K2T2]NYE29150.1 sulfite reductase (NADPH) flavoprotein alpha-component [Rhodanobacter sp. K2T2]